MHRKLSLSHKNSLGFYGIEVHCLKVARTEEEVAPHEAQTLACVSVKIPERETRSPPPPIRNG